jgi:ketosteroid isomerase-like protein
MNQTIEAQIVTAEDRLRMAMLASDISALGELLAPELLFTNHLGQLLGKEDDLASHRSGALRITELIPSERHIRIHGGVAIVSVRMQLSGAYAGNPANGNFRFTRTWAASPSGTWHLIAAHSSLIA